VTPYVFTKSNERGTIEPSFIAARKAHPAIQTWIAYMVKAYQMDPPFWSVHNPGCFRESAYSVVFMTGPYQYTIAYTDALKAGLLSETHDLMFDNFVMNDPCHKLPAEKQPDCRKWKSFKIGKGSDFTELKLSTFHRTAERWIGPKDKERSLFHGHSDWV
jgi:hypothetical protein